MISSQFNFLIYMRGFKNVLQESSGIIIYGAGKMGKLVRRYMEKEGLGKLLLGFAVSEVAEGCIDSSGRFFGVEPGGNGCNGKSGGI